MPFCICDPWFKVVARTRCRYCRKAASLEYAEVKKSSVGPFIVLEDSGSQPIYCRATLVMGIDQTLVQCRVENYLQILLISTVVRM